MLFCLKGEIMKAKKTTLKNGIRRVVLPLLVVMVMVAVQPVAAADVFNVDDGFEVCNALHECEVCDGHINDLCEAECNGACESSNAAAKAQNITFTLYGDNGYVTLYSTRNVKPGELEFLAIYILNTDTQQHAGIFFPRFMADEISSDSDRENFCCEQMAKVQGPYEKHVNPVVAPDYNCEIENGTVVYCSRCLAVWEITFTHYTYHWH
jgi:hypothetical protein